MSRRRLSDDEHALWRGVVRAITPLRRPQSASESDDMSTWKVALLSALILTTLWFLAPSRSAKAPEAGVTEISFVARGGVILHHGHRGANAGNINFVERPGVK